MTPAEISKLQTDLSGLGAELIQQAQDAHGFFVTKTNHAVGYSDPVKRAEVQQKLDHAVALLGIANLMAIFEDRFSKKYWTKVLKDSTATKRLRAYRHVRFSAVHGFAGRRAKENHIDFDKLMSSDSPMLGVREFSVDHLFLEIASVNYASTFVQEQWNKAVVAVHYL